MTSPRRKRLDRIYLNSVKRERRSWPHREGLGLMDRRHRPITATQYALLLNDIEYQVLAQAVIGELLVSTVWLGIDKSYGAGRPLIFETMIFNGPHSRTCSLLTWHYTYERQARIGHREACMVAKFLAEAPHALAELRRFAGVEREVTTCTTADMDVLQA